ncbi:MAG: hypothetical protein M3N16_07030, partial [Actinomycetota bacterium]|nr:hypothetical protein [Actinomycetota bacterium]
MHGKREPAAKYAADARRTAHHDLCFGCGLANLFGLQMELEPADGGVAGRFFLKQDHQGPPGVAHGGVLAAALAEAMALASRQEDPAATLSKLEIDLGDAAPVGSFVLVEAVAERGGGDRIEA